MKKLILILFSMFILFFSSSIYADYKVVIIQESSVPYTLSSNKYSNSPNKYSNSPNKYSNGPSGSNSLEIEDNYYVGYYLQDKDGMINFFNSNGKRLGYLPAGNHTASIFHSKESKWCGTFGLFNGERVIGLVADCYYILFDTGTSFGK